jgi:hypothetical protein
MAAAGRSRLGPVFAVIRGVKATCSPGRIMVKSQNIYDRRIAGYIGGMSLVIKEF